MLRGTTIFTCDKCGNKFRGLDIEYNCTIFPAPQKCPNCGSVHTMPSSSIKSLREVYKTIWECNDKRHSTDVTFLYTPTELDGYLKECSEWNSTNHLNVNAEETSKEQSMSTNTFWKTFTLVPMALIFIPGQVYKAIKGTRLFRKGKV